MILDWLSWILLLSGALCGIIGAAGLFRFPDLYTRMHAASVTDTLCLGLVITGLMLQSNSWNMVVKLLLVMLILAYTSPTSSHALARAARHGGLEPQLKNPGEPPSSI